MGKSSRPVRSEMKGKIPSATGSAGVYGHNHPPFDKPQSMGGGGIPTKFFETGMGGVGKMPKPTQKGPGYEGGRKQRRV